MLDKHATVLVLQYKTYPFCYRVPQTPIQMSIMYYTSFAGEVLF